MTTSRLRAILAVLLLAAAAAAASDLRAEMAVRDSFGHLPPNTRFYAMRKAGLLPPPARIADDDTGSGLRLVGKWGGGPSVKVTGRDSLVFLSRGSEVVAINFADTASPRILSYIQAQGLVSRSVLVGNQLYVGSTGSDPKYVEVFDVTDPANAMKLGQVQTMLNDIAVKDTLVYTISDDSFKVFDFANPASPTLVGACRDSGYTIAVNAGYAYLGDRWGLYVVDATNPASPHRVASWGSFVISVTVRNTICCVTLGNPNQPSQLDFYVLDISDPASPQQVGHLADHGGYDVFIDDTFAFVSGYYTGHEFEVLSIADSSHPRMLGRLATLGANFGVWADRSRQRAYIADDMEGMQVVGTGDMATPSLDATMLGAALAQDIDVRRTLAVVADDWAGMKILSIADPTRPVELSSVDSVSDWPYTQSAALGDTYAFMGWSRDPFLRTIDLSDPADPTQVGACTGMPNYALDMVLRDTMLYIAARLRLYCVNVARPRAPALVGSCVLPDESNDLWLSDMIAYVANLGLVMVSVARPAAPRILGTWPGEALGVAVRDTIAYVACVGSFVTLNVANPASPRTLDSLPANELLYDVVLVDTLAYAGGKLLHVYNIADPTNVREVTTWIPPYSIRRLEYAPPFVYVACYEAGVCILDTLTVGLAEERPAAERQTGVGMHGSVVREELVIELPAAGGSEVMLSACDMSGRCVEACVLRGQGQEVRCSFARLPAGVYVLRVRFSGQTQSFKVVKL